MEQIDLEGGNRDYEGGDEPAESPKPNVPGLNMAGLLAGVKKGQTPTVGANTDATPRPEDENDMSNSSPAPSPKPNIFGDLSARITA